MLIILSGLPGVGKTTIARELTRQLGAVHVRIDSIEEAIRGSALAPVDVADAGYHAAYAIAADNLSVGRTVVADSVDALAPTRDAWRATAGVRHLLIAAALERRADLRRIAACTGAPDIVVCRLRAAAATMEARVHRREPGILQHTFVDRVRIVAAILDRAALEDSSVENDTESVTDVAREMLVRARWLASL